MERLKGRKPSPAMVVSIIALVFTLAGSAAASVATISALSKKEKKQTRNIADSEVNKLAPGLSVKSAGALAGGGLKQSAFKLSVVVTLDYPSIPAQSSDVGQRHRAGVGCAGRRGGDGCDPRDSESAQDATNHIRRGQPDPGCLLRCL